MSHLTRFASRLSILFFALSTLACCRVAFAQDDGFTPYIDGKVLNVLSGSEIIVLNTVTNMRVRVRLRGTDAPDPKRQPYGARSLHRLASLVNGRLVKVEFRGTDAFGRVLGRVIYDNEDINLAQLDAGLVHFHTARDNELSAEDRRLYAEAEQLARKARRRLWADAAPVSPSEFRTSRGITDEPEENFPAPSPAAPKPVFAHHRTKLYYLAHCPGYARVPLRLRAQFKGIEEAERAGYAAATDCMQ
ncbi:MAG TPA: thermonuclease family protein [Pyrinomonadaceae bacterium]|nr:thermonuclease family protein [Pyrinomonadaceae bacterium]